MTYLLTAFLICWLITLLVVRYAHVHNHLTGDHDLVGIQKVHTRPVPRMGGLGIFVALISIAAFMSLRNVDFSRDFWLILLASSPAFIAGLAEDLTKRVGVAARLAATLGAAGLGYILLGANIERTDIAWLDDLLLWWPMSLCFTIVAVGGMSHAINIIDGFNGLAGMVSVIILGAIGYVAFIQGDFLLWRMSACLCGATAGFLFWNYPRGLIFLGDCGAYFLGFMIGELAVLLVLRNPGVSAWFPVLVVIYPVFETLFSIYRRSILRGASPGLPDAAHLHSLVYKRIVRWAVGSQEARHRLKRNAMVSPYLWGLCTLSVIPAIIFWHNTWVLIGFITLFMILYIQLYRRIVLFRAPKQLIVHTPPPPPSKKEP